MNSKASLILSGRLSFLFQSPVPPVVQNEGSQKMICHENSVRLLTGEAEDAFYYFPEVQAL